MSSQFLIGRRPYAVAAPTAPVPVAGSELLTNGNFEAGDTWWTKDAGVTIGSGVMSVTGVSAGGIYKASVLTIDAWYITTFDVASRTQGTFAVGIGGVTGIARSAVGTYFDTGKAGNSYIGFSGASTPIGSIDNTTCKRLTLASLISAKLYAHADIDISAAVSRTAGTQAGSVARVDDPANPANFLLALLDGAGNAKLFKVVSGTYTELVTGAVTYGAAKLLRLRCSGTSVSMFYDGTQVGTTQTVTDAGIISNKYHGLFSTYASNTFASVTASSWVAVTP